VVRDADGTLRDVAVKVLDVSGLPDWQEYERFRRQTAILESLSHPSIPRAAGDFEVRGRMFHAQTLIAGRSLAQHLRGARLTAGEATRLAKELLEILAHLHEHGVVHRDVTPDNVVLAPSGRAHLVDFGAARRTKSTADAGPEPTVVGTPGYMAPEQLRGELVPESDLYALGRLLGEALGGARAPAPLDALLPRLVRDEWRKRPSAVEALALLSGPSGSRRRTWAAVAALVLAATAGVALGVARLRNVRAPVAPTVSAPAAAPRPSLADEARALLNEWLAAQNVGDFERYSRCYATSFRGVRRTPGGKTIVFDRKDWLADRKRMYAERVQVAAEDVRIVPDEGTDTVKIGFLQRFRRGNYADHGNKELVARHEGVVLRLSSEEMLDSQHGWDDEVAPGAPVGDPSCKVSFDPSGHRYLVTLASDPAYPAARRAAAEARKKKIATEIVWGNDYVELESGFWVLAGAFDDEAAAKALAERVGGTVREVSLAPERDRRIARLLARSPQEMFSDAGRFVTVVADMVYLVGPKAIVVRSALDPGLPEKRRIPIPDDVTPVRLAKHRGAAYLLDERGNWYLVGAATADRAPSFDPDDLEGKVAVLEGGRFELDGEEAILVHNGMGDPVHWPLGQFDSRIFRVANDRLLLYRRGELYLFAVGPTPNRLTKLCVALKPDEGLKFRIPAEVPVVFGPMAMATDRSGKLEIWTSLWGFTQLQIDPFPNPPLVHCTSAEVQNLDFDDALTLFRQPSVSVEVIADCENPGDE
jgi:hypothetical protein